VIVDVVVVGTIDVPMIKVALVWPTGIATVAGTTANGLLLVTVTR
jgi:hypothetical protein